MQHPTSFVHQMAFFGLAISLLSSTSMAAIDKVYHPYVDGYVKELEYRATVTNDTGDDFNGVQTHKFALGYGFTDRFSLEGYVVGEKQIGDSIEIEAYELEAQIQLSEQGEYWSDWGILIEYERKRGEGVSELGVGVLWEKQIGRWVAALNLIPVYEYGESIDNGYELKGAGQMKYRLSRVLEPAVELYADEYTSAAGPVLMGKHGRGVNKFKWELGLMFGLNSTTADQTLRGLIEFEF